jgi:fructose-1,6-bisphosphatase-3
VSHQPFAGKRKALEDNDDIVNDSVVFEKMESRMKVADTDEGRELQQRVDDLKQLLNAYRTGAVTEDHVN